MESAAKYGLDADDELFTAVSGTAVKSPHRFQRLRFRFVVTVKRGRLWPVQVNQFHPLNDRFVRQKPSGQPAG